jgi:hypothetical protein
MPVLARNILGVVGLLVVCVDLWLGLSPFHAPVNDVTWLKDTDGILLGKSGTVFSPDVLKPVPQSGDDSGSFEAWLRPDHWSGSATFLALYRPEKGMLFTFRQSLTDFELSAEAPVKAHFYLDDAFGHALQEKRPVFITVTTSPQGTLVYLDGALAKSAPEFRIPGDGFTGRTIVGDSPKQPDSFRGEIRGLALYETELNQSAVSRHYKSWIKMGRPDVTPEERIAGLYLFNERAGNVVHNHASAGGDLYIPQRYTVVDKIRLEPFWKEFDFSRSYWSGNLKNIVGFMPTGFCFYLYFWMGRSSKRPMLATLVAGILVSLTIEVLQAFLPTRDSGTTDLITNAFGTYVGAACCMVAYPLLLEKIPAIKE